MSINNSENDQIILDSTVKKSSHRLGKGIAAASAAVVAVGAVSVAAVPSVKNSAKMAFSSPENYYADILRSTALKKSEALAKAYKEYCEKAADGASESGSFSVALGDELAEEAGIPAGTKFGIDYSASAKDNKGAGTFSLTADGTPLADVSAVMTDEMLYLAFPFVSSEWLSASSEELTDAAEDLMYGSSADELPDSADITIMDGTVLTQERTDRIFSKYTDIYLGYAKNVKLEKNREFTSASGITVKYTVASVTLTEEDVYSLATDILTAAKDDEDLQAVWKAAGGSEELYDEFISENLSDISDQQTNIGNGTFDIDLYIASNGKIMGSSASVKDDESVSNASAVTYIKGNSYSFEMFSDSDSKYERYDTKYANSEKTSFVLDGTLSGGKITGKGKLTNTSSFSYEYNDPELSDYSSTSESGVSFDIEVEDLDKNALAKGDLIGTIKLSGGDDDVSVDITLTAGKDTIDCTADILEGGEKLLTLAVSDKQGDYEEVTVPEGKTYKLLDEDSLMEYCKTLDLKKFKSNVEAARSSLGDDITDELLELIEELDEELNTVRSGENINW